jgi:hypothetical protein
MTPLYALVVDRPTERLEVADVRTSVVLRASGQQASYAMGLWSNRVKAVPL